MIKELVCPKCASKGISDNAEMPFCGECGYRGNRQSFIGSYAPKGDKKGYVITCMQNNSEVDAKAWKLLKYYARVHDFEIIVLPIYYNNVSRTKLQREELDYFPPNIAKYLVTDNVYFGDYMIASTVKVQATNSKPLNMVIQISKDKNMILGHSQRQIKPQCTFPGDEPKIGMTTGAINKPNVSVTSAGARTEFHHFKGFVALYKEEGVTIARQVQIKKGKLVDLGYNYDAKSNKITKDKVKGVIIGDQHATTRSIRKEEATYCKNGLLDVLRPKQAVLHDFFDGDSVNPHDTNPLSQYSKKTTGESDAKQELYNTYKFLENIQKSWIDIEFGLAKSNHDTMFYRHLISPNTDWMADHINAEFILESQLYLVKNSKESPATSEDLLQYWSHELGFPPINFIEMSTKIDDYVVGCHGDSGLNGSRGSITADSQVPYKIVSGHTHSPGVQLNAFRVGTSTELEASYTKGFGSWAWLDASIYSNGSIQMIPFYAREDSSLTFGASILDNFLRKKLTDKLDVVNY